MPDIQNIVTSNITSTPIANGAGGAVGSSGIVASSPYGDTPATDATATAATPTDKKSSPISQALGKMGGKGGESSSSSGSSGGQLPSTGNLYNALFASQTTPSEFGGGRVSMIQPQRPAPMQMPSLAPIPAVSVSDRRAKTKIQDARDAIDILLSKVYTNMNKRSI